jgi:seryl-tRNA synthetase
MLDIKFLRQNAEYAQRKLRAKQSDSDLTQVLILDERLRDLKHEVERHKSKRNERSKEIGELKRAKGDVSQLMLEVSKMGDQIDALEEQLRQVEGAYERALSLLVNLPMEDVRESLDPADNVCVRSVGHKPVFKFDAKHHVELNEKLHLLDFKRGAKIAGTGWPVYVKGGARLEWALLHYMMDHHLRRGWQPLFVPHCVRPEVMYGAGQLPKFAHQLFKLDDDHYPLYLIPTSEVPLTGLHQEEILDAGELPLRYVAYTPCFRREAGAAGSKERGLIRVHQFNKVEMYAITQPDASEAMFEEMVNSAASLVEGLGLHYRLMALVTGDLGVAAAKTIDVEVWLPGQDRYYEVSSVSNCTDYQARRSQIRHRQSHERAELVHTLNGSGLATSRLFVAILENNQQPDGSVTIPPILRAYMGGQEALCPS